ncbi:uncharacterized protein METZ01_LOCUS387321 [marine metagenome]|uniref:Uncharacterized protein n=1 Tax=marine metagenome TaxID=408172 RepID=A0A382UK67_9ZZZZ
MVTIDPVYPLSVRTAIDLFFPHPKIFAEVQN